jgi:hypothetical protein
MVLIFLVDIHIHTITMYLIAAYDHMALTLGVFFLK